MKQHLGLQQVMSQKLVMTPRMQQSIQLLQTTTLELSNIVSQELEQNPTLDIDDDLERVTPDTNDTQPERKPDDSGQEYELGKIEFDSNWESYFEDSSDLGPMPPSTSDPSAETFDPVIKATEHMQEHLMRQIELLIDDDIRRQIATTIIGALNENGYLTATIEELVEMTGQPPELVSETLAQVQQCEPYGIACRDLAECLEIQYHMHDVGDPLLLEIIRHHLDDLQHHRFAQIARALEISELEVQEIADDIGRFDPLPGRQFAPFENEYVTPDVYIEKMDGEYQVRVNDEGVPNLRINRHYRRLLERKEELDAEGRKYLRAKLHSAVDLIKNIEQRKQTLYRVTKEIVRQQREFLDYGIEHLKPMRLRDVADVVGVHETTVCRVVNGKYADTPQGLLELKYFFSTGLSGANGSQDTSAKSVQAMIQELVDGENPKKPLSDKKISDLLKQKDIQVARRTVAKYREQLGILPTSQRKRL